MKDAFGKDIKMGSVVTYAVVHNRTSRLRFGVVTKVLGGKDERVSVKGYSRNYYHSQEQHGDDYRWEELRPSGCSWASTKMIVTELKSLPTDLRSFIEQDLEELRN